MSAVLWSINTCLTVPSYYSCAVDAICDLYSYSFFPQLSGPNSQEFSEILQVLWQVYERRQSCSTRQELSHCRDLFWDYACRSFPNDFLPRGTIHCAPDTCLEKISDHSLFRITRELKCSKCDVASDLNHNLGLIYLSGPVLRECNFVVQDAVDTYIRGSTSRLSRCCRDTLTAKSQPLVSKFLAVLLPFGFDRQLVNDCVVASRMMVSGCFLDIVGAIRWRGDHFTCIVKLLENFVELDDLADVTKQNKDFASLLNNSEASGGLVSKRSGLWFLLLKKYDETSSGKVADVVESVVSRVKAKPGDRKRRLLKEEDEHLDDTVSTVVSRVLNGSVGSTPAVNEAARKRHMATARAHRSRNKKRRYCKATDESAQTPADGCEADFLSNIDPKTWICSECDTVVFREKLSAANVEGSALDELICRDCGNGSRGLPELFKLDTVDLFEDLTSLERRLLNLVNVFMSIVMLPGGQRGETGQAVHFSSDPQDVVLKIPEYLADAGVIVLESDGSDNAVKSHQVVRYKKILACLKYLKKNNPLFSEFNISRVPLLWLAAKDRGVTEFDFDAMQEMSFVEEDFSPVDVNRVIDSIKAGRTAKFSFRTKDQKPLSYFSPQLEEKSFVSLFPHGRYGFSEKRSKRLTLLSYFKKRLLGRDRRFRMNASYLFWALNLVEQERLQARISIGIRTKYADNAGPKDLSIEEILRNKSYTFVQSIRGSVGYWFNALMNLLAKVANLGPPTWFLTLSANDVSWVDYLVLLESDGGSKNKVKNLRNNPVMSALQFRRRWLAIRRYIKKTQVLGEVTDYFDRVEFQQRGSPHLHIFVWTKGAPTRDDPKLPQFLDQYVSTIVPEDASNAALVKKYQTHGHTESCMKNGKNSCRFRFPKAPCSETKVLQARVLGGKRFYETRRNPGEEMINSYNLKLLRLWQANMDLQFVGDPYGVAVYVCEYLCKAEPARFKAEIEKIVDSLRSEMKNLNKRQILSKFGTAVLTKRCVSAQEAAFRLVGIPLYESSRITIFINCRPQSERHRVLQVNSALDENLETTEDNWEGMVFAPSLIDHYTMRPRSTAFDSMSLAHFAAWYTVNPSRTGPLTETLLDGKTKINRRRKFACLRTNVYRTGEVEMNYFRLLLLHLPFRSELELIVPFVTYEQAFLNKVSSLDRSFYGIEPLYAELEHVIQREMILRSETVNDIIANLELDKVECAGQTQAIADLDNGEWHDTEIVTGNSAFLDLEDDVSTRITKFLQCEMTDNAFVDAVEKLTPEQCDVFLKVKNWYQKKGKDPPLRLYVSGPAGTGKSFLIKVLSELILRLTTQCPGSPSVIRAALTGVAGRNIDGLTLHRAFMLPVDHNYKSTLRPLQPEVLQNLRRFYKNTSCFIVDEISMVSYRYFDFINKRLCDIMNSNDPFGGLNVLAFGDFCQLKPVMDKFLFEPQSIPLHLFNDLFARTFLTQSMRQQGDLRFAELLNRLRLGECTRDDILCLRSRVGVHLTDRTFADALRIFPTRKQVRNFNASRLSDLEIAQGEKACVANAIDKVLMGDLSRKITANEQEAGGLPNSVCFLERARVMLIRNIDFDAGLTNGCLGTIVKLNRDILGNLTEIEVKFDNRKESVIIEKLSVKFMTKKRTLCERLQFPLVLAWACTVHKVQGLTLSKVVLDIGEKIFQPAMAYVAISRVRSLLDLSFSDFDERKLKCYAKVKSYYCKRH